MPHEVQKLHALHILQLTWASQDSFKANLHYHRLHVKKIEIMHLIATDQCNQAEMSLKKAEWQIGEIKHILDHEGLGLLEEHISLFNLELGGKEPSGSENDSGSSGSSPTSPYM